MADVWLLVGSFLALLLVGVPVAYCIGIAAAIALLANVDVGPALATVAQRVGTGLDSFTLLAIPFFVLAGQIMNRGGIARRLIDFARAWLGALPGSLAHVNVLAAMLFGALSGSAVATASAVGSVVGPHMERDGYDRGFGAAVNVAAATTGLVIPPSNILIVYSLASGGVSVAALFLAGYLPGLVVGVALMLCAGTLAARRGHAGTPFPGVRFGLRRLADAAPSLGLPVVVIGGIIGGAFTATEAAAIAVVYALALALFYGELGWRDLPGVLLDSATTTGVVMLVIGCSVALSWVLAYERIPQALTAAILGLTDDPLALLLLVNLVLLAVGTFLDMTPAVLIFTPILLPVARAIGIDPVHFGIVMVLNLCIGLCTPPVGTVLFVGCGVAHASLGEVVRPLLPLYAAMVAALLVVTWAPGLSLWLPRALGY